MTIRDLLKPTNDYVFKRLFGYVGNEDITKGSKLLKKISKTNKTAKELLDLYDACDDSVEVKKEFTKYLNTIVRGKNSDEISYDSKINFKNS